MRHSRIATLAFMVLAAPPAAGQGPRVYLSPYGGAFIPARSLGKVLVLDLSDNPIVLDGKLETSAGFGGRLAYWPGYRFGVEGSFFYTKGSLKVTDGHSSALFDSELQIGSVKGLMQLSQGTTGSDFIVSAGLAGVHHGGPAYYVSGATTKLGGTVGTGLHIDIGPQVGLRLDGEALVYDWRARGDLPSAMQVDLMITAGIAIRLSR
jgi:hypothetical protein